MCVEGAFHGRTLATLAAGWSAAKREPFEPVPAGFEHVPRNDLAALAAAVGPETCAVLVEPIQGEGGVWPIDADWLALARELCDRHGALLLYDEVQTGIGRCGAWFCQELSRACGPTRSRVAKGLAGGLPIGALLATDMPDTGFERGDHATTFGGSPPIAAAALAVLDAIEREGLVENARAVGEHIAARAAALPGVDHVRGAGLLLGIELSERPGGRGRRSAARARNPRQRDHADGSAPRAATVPLGGRGRPFLCLARGCAGRAARPACHHGGISPRCARIPSWRAARNGLSPAVFHLRRKVPMPTLTDYSVGDLVVLGHDGVARIEDISSVDIDGEAATMLKLTVLSARMTVTIPLERALDRGLRAVADPATAQIALDKLGTEPGMELVAGLTWDKQLKRLKERFGSGDLDGIVDVLATLVDADARRPLNHSQRMLRDKAEEAFITEIGAALELSPEDAQEKVGGILASRIDRE